MMPDYPDSNYPQVAPPIIESKASIKVTKNTKGYNWDIKVTKDEGMTMDDVRKEVEKQDKELRSMFG